MHLLGYTYNSLSFSVDQSHAKPKKQNTMKTGTERLIIERQLVHGGKGREISKCAKIIKQQVLESLLLLPSFFCFGMVAEYVCCVCVCVFMCVCVAGWEGG